MKQTEGLVLLEIIKAQVWRDQGGWYTDEPNCDLETGDLITTAGRTYLAQRIGANVNSPMAHMAVGTVSTAAALGDTAVSGEVIRKTLSTNSAQTANVYTAVCTFGGAADSVTSLQLVEAGILNHASSGQGTLFQRVTFSSVVLANSDLLKITLQTNVGSS